MTYQPDVAEQHYVAGNNAIIEAIHAKMGICPYYGTKEILDDILIQKESWGGKDVPENKTKLSAAANVEYMKFAERVGVEKDKPYSSYQELFTQFLVAEKPKLTEKERHIQTLKKLVTLRSAFLDKRLEMEARIKDLAKGLDTLYPIDQAFRAKALEKFRKENEPLLKEVQEEKDFSWQNLIGYSTAQMGYVQKTILEKEIEHLVVQFPIWEFFGKCISGFGTWTCAFFIAKLQDPTRFSDSGKVRAFCGMAPKGDQPMRRKRGEKVTYDPDMKEMLCYIFPESFMKTCGKFPDEPYVVFFRHCRDKQARKAEQTTVEVLAKKHGVPIERITNLGYKEEEGGRKVFKGFKVKKADGEEITTLNPGHVLQRAMREWGTVFISDFYHAWLFLMGENLNIGKNPRIMAVFARVKV
ncbi:MAG TPA: transposase [Candidatus Paceibacterota bacterium]|nr:transposase [Candidatus Paceibacterota bacterium]